MPKEINVDIRMILKLKSADTKRRTSIKAKNRINNISTTFFEKVFFSRKRRARDRKARRVTTPISESITMCEL